MFSEDQGLSFYLNSIGVHPQLSSNENHSASRERLIQGTLKLAVHIAKKYSNSTDELLENIQYANEGLCRATQFYDPSRGPFSTYAAYHIRDTIRLNRQDRFGHRLYKRKSCSEEFLHIDEGFDVPESPTLTVEEQAGLEELPKLLNVKELAAFEKALQGYTREEIAAQRGVTHQAISSLINQGLRRLS